MIEMSIVRQTRRDGVSCVTDYNEWIAERRRRLRNGDTSRIDDTILVKIARDNTPNLSTVSWRGGGMFPV